MEKYLVAKASFLKRIDQEISEGKEVIAPVKQENQANFHRLRSTKEVLWGGPQTVLSAKAIVFPPKEELLRYEVNDEIRVQPSVETKPLILLGVHPCDINGISLLDKVFTEKNVDEHYVKKRENLTIIGVECLEPCSQESFCYRKDSVFPWDGFDLFLTDMGRNFFVEVGSAKGEALISELGSKATQADLEKVKKIRKERDALFDQEQRKLKPKLSDLPRLLRENYDSPVWTERGAKCFGCGSCNMVCPTCYCFDVRDCVELDLKHGSRSRWWDGCMLTDFTRVATGEIFREDRGARLRHRTYRKDCYLFEKWGRSFCTGCGRCGKACLTKIVDPLDIANEIYGRSRSR
ncbi:MAG: 4Fe-4S dicluster domain-containing protein [Candidatus Hadarchaeum sp.]|uniref:4Fe-4S dicluster domain-containing protein n=1 Tax=Candidatus Hadarchaeum sp. TaxID=2883567 RepID=UPI003D143F1B